MRLKSAVFNNLYSFGQGVVCGFKHEGDSVKTLIIGRCNDEPGADSNGAGKSNILNSIFWVTLGEVFQEENVDDIIRKGQTWCSGEVEYVTDKDIILKIARGRGNGAKKFLKVWYNGEEQTCNTDTETQKVLLKLLNIPAFAKKEEYINDFINTVYFSSDVVKGFMGKKTTSKERFAVVERFLGLKRYALASERCKKKKQELLEKVEKNLSKIIECDTFLLNNTEDKYQLIIQNANKVKSDLQLYITGQEGVLAGQQERILLAKSIESQKQVMASTKESYIRAMDNLENEHKQNEAVITDNNKRIADYNIAKAEVEKQQPAFTAAQTQKLDLTNKISEAYNVGSGLNAEMDVLAKECAAIKKQIDNNLSCPACNAKLMIKDGKIEHIDIQALTEQLNTKSGEHAFRSETLQKIITARLGFEDKSKLLDADLTNYSATYRAFQYMTPPDKLVADNEAKAARNTQTIAEHARLSEEAKQKYGAMKQDVTEQEARLVELSKTAVDVQQIQILINNSKTKVSMCDNEIGSAEQVLKNIEQTKTLLQSEQQAASEIKSQADIFGFGETAFNEMKLDIIDEFLPDFEDKVNEYLSRLRVNMRISFDTQKEKANASKKDKELGRAYKEEFNVEVSKEDNIPIPYGLLSKGQRGRLGTCVGMALRELTQARGSNTFDFFFLDEISDALDESGLRELVSLLDETNGQKLVISHNNFLKDYFDDQIVVEMTNEISTIANQGGM